MATTADMNLPGDWMLLTGMFLIVVSCILFYKDNEKAALCLLVLSAFTLRYFAAHLDPFLHDWDEKYHALVARNTMSAPFTPVLRADSPLPYDYKLWCCNHIWLHKQPLFMWQMALSMKLFGISEFSIRYPSVIMGTLMVLLTHRITTIYTKNKLIAFTAAMFMCISNYQLELISGYQGMDHNDVAFGFYVLSSIWAYAEYTRRRNINWALLVGVFAGLAILNKWMTGLLVFSGWGINILLHIKNKDTRKEVLHLLLALTTCIIVFLPWQIYIFYRFPVEAMYEYSYSARHIYEVLEGHGGTNEFYLNLFNKYFGNYIWVLVLAGFVISFLRNGFNKHINTALFVMISVTYAFFSWVVATKVHSYFYIVAPIGFIYMALTLFKVTELFKTPRFLFIILSLGCSYLVLAPYSLNENHDQNNTYIQNKKYNTAIYKDLNKYVTDDIDIILNLNAYSDVELMFYNPGVTAHHFCPNPEEFKLLTANGQRIGVFKSRFGHNVPDYVKEYKGTYIIDVALKSVKDNNQ